MARGKSVSIRDLPPARRQNAGGLLLRQILRRARDLPAQGQHRARDDAGIRKIARLPGGIDEAIAILKLCAERWDELVVHALYDGDEMDPWETVLAHRGALRCLRGVLDVVPRRARAAHARRHQHAARVEAAKPKEVMFFPARHDHWLVQTGDGYPRHTLPAPSACPRTRRRRVGIGRDRHGASCAHRGVPGRTR